MDAVSQASDGDGDAGRIGKHRRARHQYVSAGGHGQPRCFNIDAAVHLEFTKGLYFVNHLADAANLGQRRVQERLMPESRIDGHHEYLIEVWQYLFQHARRSCRVDGNARSFVERSFMLSSSTP